MVNNTTETSNNYHSINNASYPMRPLWLKSALKTGLDDMSTVYEVIYFSTTERCKLYM